jgi:alkane 1-monooxygenase
MQASVKAAMFSSVFLVPGLIPASYHTGWWWLAPCVLFVGVPAVDALLGEDRSNESARETRWSGYFWALPMVYGLLCFAGLVWAGSKMSGASVDQALALLISCAVASSFATCSAHELLHRSGTLDRWMARAIMSMVGYGHFVVEHLHHHGKVGLEVEGTVPRVGESMWAFIPRQIAFSYRNGYRAAERLRIAKGLAWYRNRAVEQHALTAAMASAFWLAFGWAGLLLFVVQAAVAVFCLEMIQFFEHHGLVRADGEPITGGLSWNSNTCLTNAITFNITRHSDHHLDAAIPYQSLRLMQGVPTSPVGYFGLVWIALVPAVWRWSCGRWSAAQSAAARESR